MRERIYFLLIIILLINGCVSSSQIKERATSPATSEVKIDTATPPELLSTSFVTSTPMTVRVQEPVLVNRFVFLYDYLEIRDLYFVDKDTGWAIGHTQWWEDSVSSIACCKPRIFNTTDGGVSWSEINTDIISGLFNSIIFTDSTTGYIVGQEYFFDNSKALILRTNDGGKNWRRVDSAQQNGKLNYVMVTENNQFWSVGEDYNNSQNSRQSLILRSRDGFSWKVQKHPTEISGKLMAIDFSSDKVGYAVGYIGIHDAVPYIIKTIDAGESWEILAFPYNFGRLLDVTFLDDVTGYIIGQFGETGSIAITNDGGKSWTFKDLEPDIELSWLIESNNRFVIFGNCWHSWACNNLIGLFEGNEFIPFETLALPNETITAVGNPLDDGSITFITNAKPETWDAKYETAFYRYNVP